MEMNKPCLNASGASEMTQCPASTSASSKRGKNCPMIGITSSGTYLLLVPRMNSAGPSNRTWAGSLNGKSPMWFRVLAMMLKGTRNFCCVPLPPAGRWRLPRRNWRMVTFCDKKKKPSSATHRHLLRFGSLLVVGDHDLDIITK
jgi:hypothetical protein